MKLHSPQFEQGLKRAIREQISRSPELKREHRRVKWRHKNFKLVWFWRLVFSVAMALTLWVVQHETGHLQTALAALGIYLLLLLCFRIQGLKIKLQSSTELAALSVLPVTMNKIFQWQMQKFFRESAYVFVDLVLGFGTLAYASHFAPWQWGLMVIYLVATWFYLLGLAAFCVLRFPRVPFGMLASGMITLTMVLIFARSMVGAYALRLLDQSSLEVNVLLPTAWPLASFDLLNHGPDWWLLALVLPVAFVVGNLKKSLAGLQARLSFHEIVWQPASDLKPGETGPPVGRLTPRHLGPTEIEEIIASGAFLAQPAMPLRQFPDRQLWAWLTPREKALAEFAHPAGMAIGENWKRIYLTMLVLSVLAAVTGVFSPLAKFVFLGLDGFLVFSIALGTLANPGRTFQPMWSGGVNVPLYASFGLGFKELTAFFFKHTVVQLPHLIGVFVLLGGFSAWCLKMPVTAGLSFGFKLAGLMFAGRFLLCVVAFSSGSNDTARFRISSFILVLGAAALSLAFTGLGAASLFLPKPLEAFLCWAGALLVAWLLLWSYGWFYRFCRFDLISLPKQR